MMRTLLLATAAVAVLAAAGFLAVRLPIADVRIVRIEGNLTAAENQQVTAAVSTALAESEWLAASRMAAAVEAIGWVREVRVRRQWPDGLHIAVRRHTVAARWGDDSWLTAGGEVVAAPHGVDELLAGPLPVFGTAHSDAPSTMRLFGLLNESAQAAGFAIDGLYEDDTGNWTAVVADGVPLLLGNRDTSERFARFAIVYRAELRTAGRPIERVDARYDTGVAVRWQQLDDPANAADNAVQLAAATFAKPMPSQVAEE